MNFLLNYMSVRVGLLPLCKPYRELHFENSLLDTLLHYRYEALEVTKPFNYMSVRVGLLPLCKPYREQFSINSLLDTLLHYRYEALEVTKPLYKK